MVGPLAEALAQPCLGTALFEADEAADLWTLEAWFARPPAAGAVAAQVALAAAAAGAPAPDWTVMPVPARDWVAESQRQLPPVRAGRFYLHGSHDRGRAPAGTVALEIEAGRAFGSGLHETTQGCLLLLDRLLRRRPPVRHGLDLGCGSGVLALALTRAAQRPVTAADIDPHAVAATRANARANRVGRLVRTVRADGLAHRLLRRRRFHPILANILAGPLLRLAPGLADRLQPGGHLILSGLLRRQALPVLLAYRRQGLRLTRRLDRGPWTSLWLTDRS